MDDGRDMIPEFIRAIREAQPAAFLFENVKGLTRKTFRNYLAYIELRLQHPEIPRRSRDTWEDHLGRLEDVHTCGSRDGLHYRIVRRLLNAADYGVPQTRERVFIVGFRHDLDTEWHFPEPTHSRERLQYDQWVTGGYWEERDLEKTRTSGQVEGVPSTGCPRCSRPMRGRGGHFATPYRTYPSPAHPTKNRTPSSTGFSREHAPIPDTREAH